MSQKHLWTIRQAEPATGMKAWAVAQHIDAGTLVLDEIERGDVDAKGRGKVRGLSEPTIIDCAVAEQFRRSNRDFKEGLAAALRFTGIGGVECPRCGASRVIGKPFPIGETYLIAGPGRMSRIAHGCAGPDGQHFESMLLDAGREIFDAFCEGGAGVTVLNVGRVYENVRTALGLDPHDYRGAVDGGEQ